MIAILMITRRHSSVERKLNLFFSTPPSSPLLDLALLQVEDYDDYEGNNYDDFFTTMMIMMKNTTNKIQFTLIHTFICLQDLQSFDFYIQNTTSSQAKNDNDDHNHDNSDNDDDDDIDDDDWNTICSNVKQYTQDYDKIILE